MLAMTHIEHQANHMPLTPISKHVVATGLYVPSGRQQDTTLDLLLARTIQHIDT
jgi:hypothetical protein